MIDLGRHELNQLLLSFDLSCLSRKGDSLSSIHEKEVRNKQLNNHVMTGLHEFDEDHGSEASSSPGDIIYLIKDRARKSFDIVSLKEVAFNQVHLPSQRVLSARRDFFTQLLRNQLNNNNRSGHHISECCKKRPQMGWFRRKSIELFASSSSVRNGLRPEETDGVIDTPTLASNCKHQLILSEDSSHAVIMTCLHLRDTKASDSLTNSFDLISLESHKVWTAVLKDNKSVVVGVSNDGRRIWCISSDSSSCEISCHRTSLGLNSSQSDEDHSVEVMTISGLHASLEVTSILRIFHLESVKSLLIISSDGLLIRKSVQFKDKDDVICYFLSKSRHEEYNDETVKETVTQVSMDCESSFIYLLVVSVDLSSKRMSLEALFENNNHLSHNNNHFNIKRSLENKSLSMRYKLLIVDLDSLDVFSQIDLNNDVSPFSSDLLAFHVVSQEVVVFASISSRETDDYASCGITGHFVKGCHSQDVKNAKLDLIASKNHNCIEKSNLNSKTSLVVISLKTSRMTRVVCEMETKCTLLDLKVLTVPVKSVDQDKRCKMKLFMNHHDLHVIILIFDDASLHVIQSNGSHFIGHRSFDLKGREIIVPVDERGLTPKTCLDSAKITRLHLNVESSTVSMSILSMVSHQQDKTSIPQIHDMQCKLT